MNPVGLGPKNDCAGGAQQQLQITDIFSCRDCQLHQPTGNKNVVMTPRQDWPTVSRNITLTLA
jgi:hypothetical protein